MLTKRRLVHYACQGIIFLAFLLLPTLSIAGESVSLFIVMTSAYTHFSDNLFFSAWLTIEQLVFFAPLLVVWLDWRYNDAPLHRQVKIGLTVLSLLWPLLFLIQLNQSLAPVTRFFGISPTLSLGYWVAAVAAAVYLYSVTTYKKPLPLVETPDTFQEPLVAPNQLSQTLSDIKKTPALAQRIPLSLLILVTLVYRYDSFGGLSTLQFLFTALFVALLLLPRLPIPKAYHVFAYLSIWLVPILSLLFKPHHSNLTHTFYFVVGMLVIYTALVHAAKQLQLGDVQKVLNTLQKPTPSINQETDGTTPPTTQMPDSNIADPQPTITDADVAPTSERDVPHSDEALKPDSLTAASATEERPSLDSNEHDDDQTQDL